MQLLVGVEVVEAPLLPEVEEGVGLQMDQLEKNQYTTDIPKYSAVFRFTLHTLFFMHNMEPRMCGCIFISKKHGTNPFTHFFKWDKSFYTLFKFGGPL